MKRSMIVEKTMRLTLNEASKIFGINARTIRRAMKLQKLRYIVIRGRYKITFVSLLSWALETTKINNKLHQIGIGQFVREWKVNEHIYTNKRVHSTRQRGRPKLTSRVNE